MTRDSKESARIRDGLLQGRPEAIEAVRRWVSGMVYGAGWRLDDPEAAIQDIALRVLHLGKSGRIRADANFKSFVLTVARHECTDIYRREKLRSSVETGASELGGKPPADNPHDHYEKKERRELLKFIFQALPAECRRLWRWLYGDGLSASEVATRLSISVVNARVRVHRCLKKARGIREGYFTGEQAPTRAGEHG
jgi:RNA polymerase sigma factor (sigma-70 family)